MLAIERSERAAAHYPERDVVVAPGLLDHLLAHVRAGGAGHECARRRRIGAWVKVAPLRPNHPMVLACQYAILKAGCVWVPANFPNLPVDTLRQFQALDVSFVFCYSCSRPTSRKSAATCPVCGK